MGFEAPPRVEHTGAELTDKALKVGEVLGADVADEIELLPRRVFGASAG